MSLRTTIHGTFDVAVARNQLRKMAEVQGWQTTLRARSAAALTSLSEVLFFRSPITSGELVIDIDALEDPKHYGVLFQCRVPAHPLLRQQIESTRGLLERASSDFQLRMDTDYDVITLSVWDEG